MSACQFQSFSRVNIRHLFVEMKKANLLALSYLVHLYLAYCYAESRRKMNEYT